MPEGNRPGAYLGEVVRGRDIGILGSPGSFSYSWSQCDVCGDGSERWVQYQTLKAKTIRKCNKHARGPIRLNQYARKGGYSDSYDYQRGQ